MKKISFKKLSFAPSQLLSFLALFFFVIVGLTLALILLLSSQSFEDLPEANPSKKEKAHFPKNPFAQPVENYEKIGSGPFKLKCIPPQLLLPDLRGELIYFGRNERPDIPQSKQWYHLGLRGDAKTISAEKGERVYLIYQGGLTGSATKRTQPDTPLWNDPSHHFLKGTYRFSPGNQPTALWLELGSFNGETLDVSVGMMDENGNLISSPAEYRGFTLSRNDSMKMQMGSWELAGIRVDSTFLVRQKAKWIGPDLFLSRHGGEDFSFTEGRQRIDFLDENSFQSVFVKEGDFLIWDEKWKLPLPSQSTTSYPLLVVKRVDEKVMLFDLWDREGRSKTILSLIRMRDHDAFPDIMREFKFVGAKTWAQFIVECRSQRLILRPNDWLVLTSDGWHKISSPDEVDAYVSQKLQGPLFVLDKMTKQNGRQVLLGHLFNTSRTDVQEIELPASQSPLLNAYPTPIALPPPLKVEASFEKTGDE